MNFLNIFRRKPRNTATAATRLRDAMSSTTGIAGGYMSHLRDINSFKRTQNKKKKPNSVFNALTGIGSMNPETFGRNKKK